MYLTILFLPLISALISGFLGRKIGQTGSYIITCTILIITCLLSFIAFYEVGLTQSSVSINIFNWIDSEYMNISWGFIFDSLTVSMLLPVLIVSALVHIYSISYMGEDPHTQRFFAYLSMFTFFMLLLVTGDNYLLMFIGWEGVGISSYLLINYWFTRIQANKAAIKALTMNRVGDMGLSIGLYTLFWIYGSLDFSIVFSLTPFVNENIITIIGICLLIAAMGKSAQIPLHTWLPDAMEGPTPVSALIHAATMVTAGVYLLLRSSPLIEYGSTVLIIITWVGAITAFFAATTGLLQNDLKRVIAYSTCSQLGYMIMACGLSQYNVALFHLVNHAFFKALLFLAAGSVIHAFNDQQDMRKLGGLINFLPFTYTMILIGSLSLIAIPFLSGFYSKDLILELAYAQYQFNSSIAYWLGTISAIFTAFYSLRLISLTFFTYPNGPQLRYLNIHEAPFIMAIPLIILSLLSIMFGYFTKDLFVGIGNDFFNNVLYINPNNISIIEAEYSIPMLYKLLPVIGTIFGSILALILYHNLAEFTISLTNNKLGRNLYKFLNQKYYFDIIINNYVIYKTFILSYITSKILDKGVIEMIGPYGIENILYHNSYNIASFDTGLVTQYALYIAIGIISFIFILFGPILLNNDSNIINGLGDIRLILIYISALFLLNTK